MAQRGTKISLIICTHNPRVDFLNRTLEGLKAQTLPLENWEFLLVDNASKESVKGRFDLTWHPKGRHVLETELGLTAARLRGIGEAIAPLLIFVDDDNILEADYLEQVLAIASREPSLGVFGGNCIGEFEREPADHVRPFLGSIAIKNVQEARWGNFISWHENMPVGAGMVMRSSVAHAYRDNLHQDPLLKVLGRKGTSLASCEDTDIIITAHSLGLASGLFPELRLVHLIPASRLEDDYIIRLMREGTASLTILEYIRFNTIPEYELTFFGFVTHTLTYMWKRVVDPFRARVMAARRAGRIKGMETIREISQEGGQASQKYPVGLAKKELTAAK